MRKFYTCIVNHKKTIMTVFVLLFFACLFMQPLVSVDYDINDYLPKDSPSTVSLNVMEDEFEGGIPNARVMVRNVTIPQALDYKMKLSEINGVTDVTWLDDVSDLKVPIETMDERTVQKYYRDNTALFTITISDADRIEAVAAVRDLIGEDNFMSGSAVSTADATVDTVKEVREIAIGGVLFAFCVLLLTTTSWLEPAVILGGLGVAVVINAGTNLMFGQISFVTNAAGNILQLAVSLDYSVFLLHRFEECRREISDVKEAMIEALCKSTSSILSSGLTTVIGFLALTLMRFEIGPDMGFALAKGVLISLITVFVFMPVLILTLCRLMDRARHRSLLPSFQGFGRFICRVMVPMTCVFFVVIVPSYLASNSNFFYYGASHIFGEGTRLGADVAAIEEVFGKSDTYVLMVPAGNTYREKTVSEELHEIEEVSGIVSYVDTVGAEVPVEYLDTDIVSKLVSENYSRMVISVNADYEGAETFALVKSIREVADRYYPGSYLLAGEGISTCDLMETVTSDMTRVNLVAIGAVFVVLMLTMRSVFLPAILVLGIETAIWINLSVPYFGGSPIFYIAYLIISSIQLGATVDYAILFTDRYRELRQRMDKRQAVVGTVDAVTASVLTSGSALTVVGFLMGCISSHGLLSQLGMFLGRGTLCSLTIVLFVLPGLLYIFDGMVCRPSHKRESSRETGTQEVYIG